MIAELKPCPFCGERATDKKFSGKDEPYATCLNDDCGMHNVGMPVDAWNTRHIPEGYALINLDSVLVPRGQPMPQTIEAWQYLGHQYEKELLANRDEINGLRAEVNNLRQKMKCKEGYALVPIELISRAASTNMENSINWRKGVIRDFANIKYGRT